MTDEEKDKLRSIDEQLSIESIQFGQVVLKDTNDFFLHLSDQQLDGLTTSALENAKEEARSRGMEDGGVVTLQAPSYGPAMSHLKDPLDPKRIAPRLWIQRAPKEKTTTGKGSSGSHNCANDARRSSAMPPMHPSYWRNEWPDHHSAFWTF